MFYIPTLIVRFNFSKKAMSISKNGVISLVDPIESVTKHVTCPETIKKEFGESAYLRCLKFEDREIGSARYLAFDMPCT